MRTRRRRQASRDSQEDHDPDTRQRRFSALRTRAGSSVRSFGQAVAHRTTAPPQRHDRRLRTALAADAKAILGPIRTVGQAVGGLLVEPDPPPRSPGRHRSAWLTAQAPVLLAIASVVMFLVGMPTLANRFVVAGILVPIVAALITLPLWFVAATPLRAWRVAVLLGLVLPILSYPRFEHTAPWPITQVLITLAVYYAVAVRHHWRIVLAVWVATPFLVTMGALVAGSSDVAGQTARATIVFGLALLVGYLVGARGEMERRLDEGERQRAESETQRAVLEERARIARELHDVVAHHMSMISVQAETAPFRIPDLGDDGRACLASIAETSREALTDMRRLLGVLRDGQRGAERSPQPDLGQLDQLVAGAQRAGLAVDLDITGDVRPLLTGTELSAYRIVQEGLSNVASHAPNAVVHVELDYAATFLLVRVVNEPSPSPTVTPPPGQGHGLLGMRERATLLGGTLEAGPLPSDGYRVEARLPLVGKGLGDDVHLTEPGR